LTDKIWTDAEAIDAWLTWLQRSRGRSKRTLEAYGLAMKRLREFLGEHGVAVLDADQMLLEHFSGLWLHHKGIVARSRVPYIAALRSFYKYARARSMVRGNPAGDLQHPRMGGKLPRSITLANAERLMWAPDMSTFKGVRDALILALLAGCGLRVSGLVGLNESSLRQVEIEGKPRIAVRVSEKGQRERWTPLPREADMLLRVYLEHEELQAMDRSILVDGKADKVLIVSVRCTKPRLHLQPGEQRRLTRKAVRDMIQFYGRRLGIPSEQLHPHAMRHLFGTELAEDDVPTASAADLMGHADLKSTSIYQQLALRKKTALMDQHAPLAKMRTPVSDLLKRLPTR